MGEEELLGWLGWADWAKQDGLGWLAQLAITTAAIHAIMITTSTIAVLIII